MYCTLQITVYSIKNVSIFGSSFPVSWFFLSFHVLFSGMAIRATLWRQENGPCSQCQPHQQAKYYCHGVLSWCAGLGLRLATQTTRDINNVYPFLQDFFLDLAFILSKIRHFILRLKKNLPPLWPIVYCISKHWQHRRLDQSKSVYLQPALLREGFQNKTKVDNLPFFVVVETFPNQLILFFLIFFPTSPF